MRLSELLSSKIVLTLKFDELGRHYDIINVTNLTLNFKMKIVILVQKGALNPKFLFISCLDKASRPK